MAPVNPEGRDVKDHIEQLISANKVMIFSKTTCSFCRKTKAFFKDNDVSVFVLELDQLDDTAAYQKSLKDMTGQTTVPVIFINRKHIGGCSDVLELHDSGKLMPMITQESHQYDYDLIVIGGGSGGLAAAKAAGQLGKKVACCDFVKPSPRGSVWGLGGTCVNVGCIPKKFMHHASLLGKSIDDARNFGWEFDDAVTHNWDTLRDAVQDYIGSLNWNYKVELRDVGVAYHNGDAELLDPHTVKLTSKKNKVTQISGQTILLAMGGRPVYPDVPGAGEYAITSDDIFSLPHPPGKTLCIGASYVSLECAGFLRGLGYDTTVMVRSILLRGFDQEMAEKVGEYMEAEGVVMLRSTVPTKIEKVQDGPPSLYKVTAKMSDGEEIVDEYNTVLIATGRAPNTSGVGLDTVGVKLNKSGYVVVDECEKTNIDNIYALGDIIEGQLELTPLAIQAGKLLVARLYANSKKLCDYINVPTTVFTPLEYGCIGFTEEAANTKYGEENIEVYHRNFLPYEWVIPAHTPNACYAKLVCLISQNEKVIGFHVVGPSAGEITQGYAVAMKAGATKAHFDDTIGIHPTSTEVFTTMSVTKRSGVSIEQKGCGG